jgi:DNA end-binding protein Ku
MAPRANWKGYLKLSLVSCAVALYPATSSSGRVHFHTLSRGTGHRVKRQFIDPLESDEQVKGYEVGKGSYILIEDEELEAIRIASTHTIDIESFVPRKEVDEIYLDESYYLTPNDGVGVEAFAVIRDAMKEKGLVGLARVVLYRRERLLMLEPRGKGITGTLLRYRNEVRDEADYFDDVQDVKVPKDMLQLAEHILDTKKAKFDPSKFEDRYETALKKLIAAKQSGKKLPSAPEPKPTNVINLMDALRKSVQAERGSAATGQRGKASGRRASARAAPKRKKLKRAS